MLGLCVCVCEKHAHAYVGEDMWLCVPLRMSMHRSGDIQVYLLIVCTWVCVFMYFREYEVYLCTWVRPYHVCVIVCVSIASLMSLHILEPRHCLAASPLYLESSA